MKLIDHRSLLSWGAAVCLALVLSAESVEGAANRTEVEGFPSGMAIATEPPPGTTVYAVEETLPPDVVPGRVSHDGAFDPYTRKVKWGPFSDDQPRELTFALPGAEGSLVFSGEVAYEGAGRFTITGVEQIVLPELETFFGGWQQRHLPTALSSLPADYVVRGADQPLLVQYAMGREPARPGSAFRIVASDSPPELRYVRDLRRNDVTVSLERSNDLDEWTSWHPSTAESVMLDDHVEEIRMRAEESHRFYRIRVRME